ncbi:840_t:CDS:2 [Cetraspora pellucida]|uniref:840_t:CDS:1 n=1 Tax=Cetraspora pellucida TaxID=1433469 RepID=A0ACA9MGL0_9GLOM|nr:840_t:CDS:2 [Cetraspora pellucida]
METSVNKIPTILIVGAGIGGLSFYQSARKNLDQKFNVKIFDRETSPQGSSFNANEIIFKKAIDYFTSLFYCTPSKVQNRLIEAIPSPTSKEHHSTMIIDHAGNLLFSAPQQNFNIYEMEPLKHDFAGIVAYRNILRDVLLDGVDVQWGKKCVGYEESEDGVWALFDDGTREFGDLLIGADGINSPIRKQMVPDLKILDPGVTSVDIDVVIPKYMADKLMNIYKNAIIQWSLGKNGDAFLSSMRYIPVNESDEPRYRLNFAYHYPTILDINENNKLVDDNYPESVVKHTISRIKQLRPPGELRDLIIEILSLALHSNSGYSEKYPFRTYNPIRRRQLRDIDPLSVPDWKDGRVVLLGDAAHAMNPILGLGANNAMQDADLLTKELINYEKYGLFECIKRYNKQMRDRSSKAVLASRYVALKQAIPLENFGLFARNFILRAYNMAMHAVAFIQTHP